MSEKSTSVKFYQRNDLTQPDPNDPTVMTVGNSTWREPKPWQPHGVTLKEKLDSGEIVHIRDFDRPDTTDADAVREYSGMLWAHIETFGFDNVSIGGPVDTLGDLHPGTNREVIDTQRAGLYIAAAALSQYPGTVVAPAVESAQPTEVGFLEDIAA